MPYIENIKVGSGESWPIRDKEARELIANLWSTIYPVGSIYMSVIDISPEELFGGTWERIKDTFLLAAGDTYAGGEVGGEATHTLTEAEMPKHNHAVRIDGNEYYAKSTNSLDTENGNTRGLYMVGESDSGVLSTVEEGGGDSHNNMPPYLAVYVWKRTA